jgi:hypothetical protein
VPAPAPTVIAKDFPSVKEKHRIRCFSFVITAGPARYQQLSDEFIRRARAARAPAS